MSEKSNSSGMTQSDSKFAVRMNAYQRASAMLAFVGGGLALIGLRFVFWILVPVAFIFAVIMLVGGVLIWIDRLDVGITLVLVGGLFGGFTGHGALFYELLATVFKDSMYYWLSFPLGWLIPAASIILAFMSRRPSKTKLPQSQ